MAAPSLSRLSDRELLSKLQALARRERLTTIEILRHLNEVERRRLYAKQGFSSMFDYCTRSLRYSASAAARRIRTARCLRRYPALERLLAQREVSLSTVALIAPILGDRNAHDLLTRIRGRSQREVEAIVAEYRPPVTLRDRVRPVRVRVAEPSGSSSKSRLANARGASANDAQHRAIPNHCRSGSKSTQVSEESNVVISGKQLPGKIEKKLWVQFVASEAFMKRYEEVRALLGNRIPVDASFETIFGILMEEYVERHSPERKLARRKARRVGRTTSKNGKSGSPERSRSSSKSFRHVPARVRDAVMVRDKGRCTFVASDGTRCSATKHLEIDHVHPFSRGGAHQLSNLRLLCPAHNRIEAERVLGVNTMRRFRRRE
jgi:5-methylcytosine-specific restriction endonuclease McrA